MIHVGGGRRLHRSGGRILHTPKVWRFRERSGGRRCTGGSNECCYVTIWSGARARPKAPESLGSHGGPSTTGSKTGQLDRELDGAPVRYAPRPPVARKVDPFRGIIEARLAEFPKLTAMRLLAEIRAAGYAGGYTQLKEYVRRVRPTPIAEPVVRFETPPGQQAQAPRSTLRTQAQTPIVHARIAHRTAVGRTGPHEDIEPVAGQLPEARARLTDAEFTSSPPSPAHAHRRLAAASSAGSARDSRAVSDSPSPPTDE